MSPARSTRRYARALLLAAALVATAWVGVEQTATADDQPPWDAPARAARKKNPVPSDDGSIAAGKAVYVKECLQCHGALGKGDGPASKDLNPKPHDLSAEVVGKQTDGALFWKLTEGRKPMPSYEKTLTEAQRWQAINFVRTLSKK